MKKSLQQIFELLPTLVNDVKIAKDNIDDKQYSRRVYIRTLFAMIEGSIYAMKIALFNIFYNRNMLLTKVNLKVDSYLD